MLCYHSKFRMEIVQSSGIGEVPRYVPKSMPVASSEKSHKTMQNAPNSTENLEQGR